MSATQKHKVRVFTEAYLHRALSLGVIMNPNSINSTSVILGVIYDLTGERVHSNFEGVVTATVTGTVEIEKDTIQVLLTNDRTNYATIDIMWEDYGYKKFEKLGLYGRMSTQWQKVEKTGERAFTVFSDTYEIEITY